MKSSGFLITVCIRWLSLPLALGAALASPAASQSLSAHRRLCLSLWLPRHRLKANGAWGPPNGASFRSSCGGDARKPDV